MYGLIYELDCRVALSTSCSNFNCFATSFVVAFNGSLAQQPHTLSTVYSKFPFMLYWITFCGHVRYNSRNKKACTFQVIMFIEVSETIRMELIVHDEKALLSPFLRAHHQIQTRLRNHQHQSLNHRSLQSRLRCRTLPGRCTRCTVLMNHQQVLVLVWGRPRGTKYVGRV